MAHKKKQPNEPQDFFDKPKNIQWILRIFYGLSFILVMLDFVVDRHTESQVEELTAFYAVYGFVACVILVILAAQMRKFLMRDEDYYQKISATNTQEEVKD